MPGPDRVVVQFRLSRYETAFDRRLGKFLECRPASGCHHQSDPVVGQPAVDRLHEVQSGVVEEEAVCAQNHVVKTQWQSIILVAVDCPRLHRKITIGNPDFNPAVRNEMKSLRVFGNVDSKDEYRFHRVKFQEENSPRTFVKYVEKEFHATRRKLESFY